MCGIAGVRMLDAAPVGRAQLDRMAACLAHRGPDESATWADGALGLAHTRLSIIDLAASHQPMHSADGRWVLVFNGEIFNYRELRRRLDYPFTTQGDTEVILAGLAAHGIDFVSHLRGQFAFAAHDRVTDTTHLVRDRLGILPLYWARRGAAVCFGSEVKALLASDHVEPQVDLDSLDAYLTHRAVPAPHTLFRGVHKVRPGHRVELTRDAEPRHVRYWQPPAVEPAADWPAERAIEAVDRALRDAVRVALVADVPVGSYLSGGVDSSLIVALVKDLRGPEGEVQTFAAGFDDPRLDELPWARRVSEHVGTEHHEVHVRPRDFLDLWGPLTWHRGAPVSEPADVAVFRLAESARRHVKVVLSGEGGDELFAGYPKYRMARMLGWLDAVPAPARARAARAVDPLLRSRLRRMRVAVRAAGAPDEAARFDQWFAPFTHEERRRLLGGDLPDRPWGDPSSGDDVIARMLRHDLASWLPDNLLERGDRMSMAASLELRPAMLDHRFVELALSLPSTLKVHKGTTKWLLKEVARRYLPDEVVDRPKAGFRVPLDRWFRTDLRDEVHDRLTGPESFVAEAFDRDTVRRLVDRHDSGDFAEEAQIWTLLSLDVWHETFFRSPDAPTPATATPR